MALTPNLTPIEYYKQALEKYEQALNKLALAQNELIVKTVELEKAKADFIAKTGEIDNIKAEFIAKIAELEELKKYLENVKNNPEINKMRGIESNHTSPKNGKGKDLFWQS